MPVLSRRRFAHLALAGGTGALCAGTRIDQAHAAQPLSFQASWVNDSEFLGYYVAIDNGYYKAEGLEVDYLTGGPDVIPESALISGTATIALTTPDTTIRAIVEQGARLKIIGTQYQKSPVGVVSLASSNIKSPKDLIGKTLACPPVNLTSAKAMLTLNGVPDGAVRIIPYQYDPTPLIEGDIAASIDFVTNVPFMIEQAGKKASSFLLYDFGFTTYNDTVVVSEDALATNRAGLVKWLRASRKGWEVALKDPSIYPKNFKDSWFKGTGRSIESEVYYANTERPIIEHAKGIFTMTDDDIAKNIEAFNRVGIKATKGMFDTSLLAEIG
jgi:ABC-type nitrate/sulfonate/bicarbonate transport system substrate-binding protein